MLKDCPRKPNCVCTQATRTEQRMPPLSFTGTPPEVIDDLLAVLAEYPRVKIIERSDNYLHATFTSRICRFVDDVEFLVDADTRQLHFRSASRLGYHDLGANRKRMQQITRDLLRLDRFHLFDAN